MNSAKGHIQTVPVIYTTDKPYFLWHLWGMDKPQIPVSTNIRYKHFLQWVKQRFKIVYVL